MEEGTSSHTTNCSPQNAPSELHSGTNAPTGGALDLDLHSRVFLGCRNIACAVCRSVAHTTTNCPRINPSTTSYPEPTSAKSRDQQPSHAQTTNHQLHYVADNRQPCFSFNNRECIRQRCRYPPYLQFLRRSPCSRRLPSIQSCE